MNKSLLLVGIEHHSLTYINLLLEREGYETYKCFDSHNLKHLLANRQFDLVIIDDQRPTLDAAKLCLQLRQNPQTVTVPIILLLPVSNGTDTQELSAGCCSSVITKPIFPHLLFKLVAEVVADPKF